MHKDRIYILHTYKTLKSLWFRWILLNCMADSQSPHQNQQNHLHHLALREIQTAIQKHFHKSCWILFLQFQLLTFLCLGLAWSLSCSKPFFPSSTSRKVAVDWSFDAVHLIAFEVFSFSDRSKRFRF